MANTAVVTARIDETLAARLDKLARAYDRPRGWVIAQALDRYLGEELDLLESLAEAEADFATGRFFTQEQVEEMFDLRRGKRAAA